MQGGGGLSHNNLSLGRKGGILKSKKQTARGNRAAESRGKSQRERIKHPFCFSSFLNHGLGMWSGSDGARGHARAPVKMYTHTWLCIMQILMNKNGCV